MAETGIKRELKKKWGLSYFLIMMIPLILFLVFAMASIHTVRNSVDKSNTAALSALSNELNSAFMEVDALCEELILTDDFTVFSSRSLQDFDTYSLYLRTLDLRHMVNTRSYLSDCVLYSAANDLYITAQYYGKLSSIGRNNVLEIRESGILDRIIEDSNQNYTYVIDVSDGRGQYNLLVIRPLSFIRSATIGDLCVAVLVDISSIISGVVSQTYDIVMYDTDLQKELFHFGTHVNGHYEHEKLEELGSQGGSIGKDRIMVADSSIRGIKYYLIVNESDYFQDLYTIIWFSGIVLILALVISLAVIKRIVSRHWGRFSDAVQASGTDIKTLDSVSNPYEPFVSSVTKLKEENRSHIINRIVMTEDSQFSAQDLSEMGLFSGEGVYCIVLAMFGDKKPVADSIEKKLSDRGVACIGFESDYDISYICNASTDDAVMIHDALETSDEILYFAISKSVEDPTLIHRMFVQACNIMEYRKTMVMSDSGSEGYAVYLAAKTEIENNYNDIQLNVSQIADRLGVSIVYLSKCFKKHKETNISDYLTAYRLSKAKEILSDRKCWNLSMKDVSERCGFGSIRTFMRVFKESEGVSPGQFKAGALASEKEGK